MPILRGTNIAYLGPLRSELDQSAIESSTMSIRLHEPQFEGLAQRLRQHEIHQLGLRGYTSACDLPDGAGHMRVDHTDWAQQVKCFMFDYDMDDDFELVLSANRDNRITFFIDGDINMRETNSCRDLGVRTGNAILRSSHSADQFVVKVPRKKRHSIVQLRINRDFFGKWLKDTETRAQDQVLDDLHVYDGRVAYNARWSDEIDSCLKSMIRCGHSGPLRLSYLGAKSVELLTLFSKELGRQQGAQVERADRAKRAHSLLMEDLARPSSVSDLARRLNWNVSDLQVEFKKLYGQPVHAYLKSARLERAAYLLRRTNQSVLMIAMDTGWQCQSRFSSAFRIRFGVPPTAFRSIAKTQNDGELVEVSTGTR